ncbi:aminodeoxychorismate synthase component I [Brachybacterium phenoliresistens]|uniref:Aminobenzoate synthetase n=1 Tax=Brachybacterium phenoliresistens TaxID=396014 RepID=Z9JYC3_9MICO|nr:aminodeoxychorismate synthase component I [Brachybacterium phenoliresistens]EWS82993.1 aminobenzoate synthetase [Brachybacterium phenoliresistens]
MPHARFDDLLAGTVVQFSEVSRVIEARTPGEVRPALRAVQEAVDAGAWAFGMIAYEAAAGLDPDARVIPAADGVPLVRFGIADAPDDDPAPLPEVSGAGEYRASAWRGEWSRSQHAERIAAVRAAIAEGDTYQVNLTHRLHGRIEGDLLACYRDLAIGQRAAHSAYLDLGRWAVLSASPESFVHRQGSMVTCVPMKGTAPRAAGPARDAAARADLLRSEKERAENVMIADLLRNDLARIARPGTVRVPQLLQAEAYPTLWQLTSTITAEVDPDLGLEELMAALFPCGSITGAPKLSTMGIIAELESSPRGVYCGAVGLLAPRRRDAAGEQEPETRFSVAIRTVVVDREDGAATYGVGGGVTWGSRAEGEWDELATKSQVLERLADPAAGLRSGDADPAPPSAAPGTDGAAVIADPGDLSAFGLLETLAVDAGAPRHLEEHLDRLEASADRFAIPCERAALRALLRKEAAARGTGVLRLHLDLSGTPTVTARQLPPAGEGPVLLALDDRPRDPEAPEVRHKTTDRASLDAALRRARARDARVQDVVLTAPGGLVTETGIANLLVRLDGTWCTPPQGDGCLPGIGRRLLLERGEAVERSITVAELRAAEEIALISSVRGRRRARLLT